MYYGDQMRGNHWQSIIGITGFGESHGPVMGVLLEDVRSGIDFPLDRIQELLNERRPGQGEFSTKRNEADKIKILSGVFEGKTTGMPICLIVENRDHRSSDYSILKDIFRPGHADYSWFRKFKIIDYRGGGRASGRETIARVAASGLVEDMLGDISVESYPVQIGSIVSDCNNNPADNKLKWRDNSNYSDVIDLLENTKKKNDSIGAVVQINVKNMPAGLGDPVFKKLDAKLSEALMSIGGIKGIEFGAGFALAGMSGSQANDNMNNGKFLSNNCGGVLGGVSTGEIVTMRVAIKPVPSIGKQQKTMDKSGTNRTIEIDGRHDVCLVPRILPVINAMVKLVLADCISYEKLSDTDSVSIDFLREAIDKVDEDILLSVYRRNQLVKQVAELKKRSNREKLDSAREDAIKKQLSAYAEKLNISTETVEKIWSVILRQSKIDNYS